MIHNSQVKIFGGFAPNLELSEVLSKVLGEQTVLSESVNKGKNEGYRAVTTKSFLICRHGGIIEPLDSGQVMIESGENNQ
nr:hypothetical protein [uncultured Tyzzerella sp.]